MFQTVEVPVWLFGLIILFALIAFFSHFLFPSVRWFFRHRMQRAVARLNLRLERPIQPFKLMARHDMIVRLVHDPKVAEAVAAEAADSGEPETVVLERTRRYAREIVPSFSAMVYFGFATRAARWLTRMMYRVRFDQPDVSAIPGIDNSATLIFVMNHRSNMDYVLVTHLAADRSALSYAVGEWARVWPLSWLIRSTGAYFIRRRSNTMLYRRVLSRYVQMATAEGVSQAIFPEGGLSLDGRVGAARLGILSYIVSGFRPGGRDVVFIPVALGYDRVLEDRVLVAAREAGVRRFRAPFGQILAFINRHFWRAILGRFRRFGDAAVAFGQPLSLAGFVGAGPVDGTTEDLARVLMSRITDNIPVLSVPLIAAAWGDASTLDVAHLTRRAQVVADRLAAAGRRLSLPEGGVPAAVEAALAILTLRHIIRQKGASLQLNPADAPLMDFYAASVEQLLVPEASAPPADVSGAGDFSAPAGL